MITINYMFTYSFCIKFGIKLKSANEKNKIKKIIEYINNYFYLITQKYIRLDLLKIFLHVQYFSWPCFPLLEQHPAHRIILWIFFMVYITALYKNFKNFIQFEETCIILWAFMIWVLKMGRYYRDWSKKYPKVQYI